MCIRGIYHHRVGILQRDCLRNFINSLELFGLGTSWGCYESLVIPAIPHHLRALAEQPDKGCLDRFHVGLEDPRDLCKDIRKAHDHVA
ncbi:PLP-dependent transferase [Pseudomonas sp. BNK-15]|uniref:PLP-dependent transferase n=1 Tax=Pseudomonas TaxID=286 RepID=UPI0039BF526A